MAPGIVILEETWIHSVKTPQCWEHFTIQGVTICICVHATTDKHQRSYAEGRETQPLDETQRKDLEAALKGFMKQGQTLLLTSKVDPAILGGMIVSIGDKYIDMSIASKVKKYSELITAPSNIAEKFMFCRVCRRDINIAQGAECYFTSFLVEQNIPIIVAYHAGSIFKKSFPDLEVSKKYMMASQHSALDPHRLGSCRSDATRWRAAAACWHHCRHYGAGSLSNSRPALGKHADRWDSHQCVEFIQNVGADLSRSRLVRRRSGMWEALGLNPRCDAFKVLEWRGWQGNAPRTRSAKVMALPVTTDGDVYTQRYLAARWWLLGLTYLEDEILGLQRAGCARSSLSEWCAGLTTQSEGQRDYACPCLPLKCLVGLVIEWSLKAACSKHGTDACCPRADGGTSPRQSALVSSRSGAPGEFSPVAALTSASDMVVVKGATGCFEDSPLD
ncbi:hypothetical protein PR048_015405 [Dryococelus australis]|uniref:ATP synthase subunit O, mitochondrial n=1 Tax=Dryococelus australis TaxID=614101 RepID=A0ABQ9HGV1_9NEOP|nr:hypothetical protein PR048_015405 [Dryococelus australis]